MNPALETLKERGFFKQCSDLEGLSNALDQGGLSFYIGCDPTGPSLHIGHMVPFFAFRHLRAAGHRGIALIGGGTARIGDPSGKSSLRKLLSYSTLDKNAELITAQLHRFIDFDGQTALTANNKTWLAELNYIDFLRDIGSHFSVNRMLSFEAYRLRLKTGLSFVEFNYQLLQSYDFLELYRRQGCRLQIGGDDQWGNIVAGIELIRRLEGVDCYGLTFPLITSADGKKMGKTEKGALFLDPAITSPYDFFQYWRNIQDADLKRFLLMFTYLPTSDCLALADAANPNPGKERLAYEVTALIHGQAAAEKALAGAQAAFSGGGDKAAIPTAKLALQAFMAGYNVVDIFFDADLVDTKSQARRLIQQGGAFVRYPGRSDDWEQLSNIDAVISRDNLNAAGELYLRAGKKRICRVIVD